MKTISFKDQVAVVTGSGGGLGKTYALELARRGCRVVVNDPGSTRDGKGESHRAADEVVAEIRANGGEAIANYDSVATPEGGCDIIQAARAKFGKLDILIHNAGILRDRSFANMSVEEWQSVIDVHLSGAFHVTSPAWKLMKDAAYGRILFTTSVSGLFGNFGQSNYGAAKLGMVGLMNTLVIEGAKYGIRVNALSPTAHTRMTEDLDRTGLPEVSRDPLHVTPAAVFLVSDECHESGAIIHAGHGFYGKIQVAYNPGVFLGREPASVERFAESFAEITRENDIRWQSPETRYMNHVYKRASSIR